MTNPRSLSFQASCIRELIACARSDAVREGAEGALATILWIEKGQETIRMLEKLRRQRPELFSVMREIADTFPGVNIDDIRGCEPSNNYAESGDQ